MINKVRSYIKSKGMLKQGDKVIVGVSGGADSVCLLLVLLHLKEEFKIEIEAVHVHHGLRGIQADEDAQYVQNLCEVNGVFCHIFHRNLKELSKANGWSEEEAGRKLRYQCFYEVLEQRGGNKIAVAHHKEDSAETILFHLFRGSGLKGLAGIQGVRDQIIRPLLCCGRDEIEEYLSEKEISYQTDVTNLTDDYTRNKIRNYMLPYAKREINDGALENILHAGEIISEADEYFEEIANKFYGKYVREKEAAICIEIESLKELKPILQGYVFRRGLQAINKNLKDFTRIHFDSMKDLLEKEVGKQINLPYGLIARRDYEELVIEKETNYGKNINVRMPELLFTDFPYQDSEEIPKKRYTKWFDCDKIKGTLIVRTREEGDYIEISPGQRKKLKNYMIDCKIPRKERDTLPLLAEEHHILWIIGYRTSEGYKVTKETKNILQVKYDGGDFDE